jgi:hypothetical protein
VVGREAAAGGDGAPPYLDTTIAHPARVYDYWLGGKDNFDADRVAAAEVVAAMPGIVPAVRANRAFLRRAVQYLAGEAGIRQFLDIGTGLPTADNTHEVAQAVAPESLIVYVDNDPIVLTHARALLTSRPEGARVRLRRPQALNARYWRRTAVGWPTGTMTPATPAPNSRRT